MFKYLDMMFDKFYGVKDTPINEPKSDIVLQEWVMQCTLKQQTTLLSVIRGTDTDNGMDDKAKLVTRMFRYLILVDADKSTSFMDDNVLKSSIVNNILKKQFGTNKHWVEHIVYASKVISNKHPNQYTQMYYGHIAGNMFNFMNKVKKEDRLIKRYNKIYNIS